MTVPKYLFKFYNLHFQKKRFTRLKVLSERENIIASEVTLRRIIKQWNSEASIEDKRPVDY